MAKEQIAKRTAEKIGDPPLSQMMGPVMDHVAALTEASKVLEPVVGRIVVKMRRGENYPCAPYLDHLLEIRPVGVSPPPVAPGFAFRVIPASVWKEPHRGSVWAAAVLADPAGALEAHPTAELPPVRGVQAAKVRADRHYIKMLVLSSCFIYLILFHLSLGNVAKRPSLNFWARRSPSPN